MSSLTLFLRQHQRRVHAVILIAAVSLYFFRQFGLPLPLEIANSISFAVLAYILSDVSSNTNKYSKNKTYEQQAEMNQDIIRFVQERGAREVTLIQFSGKTISHLLHQLLRRGTKVTLYLQSPDSALSDRQRDRIEHAIRDLPVELKLTNPCQLDVYLYDAPATLKAVLIDDKLVAVGWYLAEHLLEPDAGYPDDSYEISGHDVPGTLIYHGTPEFAVCRDMVRGQAENFREFCRQVGRKPVFSLPGSCPGPGRLSREEGEDGHALAHPNGVSPWSPGSAI